ncbi:unnamed protein product [marine sediment metagenome]|uniref:Uncharacterized protein n=1 Tax=marine sediment metagenome TaxID=412755 RepID=X1U2L9_9ZZZZ
MKVGKLTVVWGPWFQTYSIFDKVRKLPFIPIILPFVVAFPES